ncbi:MAG: O-antigen ligase family protein [Planctomycetota bacterium]|jgi:hypothetical protein
MTETLEKSEKLSLWQYAGFVTLLVFPVAEAALKVPLSSKRSLNLTLFDVTLFISFILLVVDWIKSGDFSEKLKSSALSFLPSLLFLLITVFTYSSIDRTKSSSTPLFVKLFIQYAEYLFIAPVVFWALIKTELKTALSCVCIGFTVSVVSCFVDNQFCENESSFYVGGFLLNRNNFAAYFAMALPPVISCLFYNNRNTIITIISVITAAVGAWFVQAAWALTAVFFCLIISLVYSAAKKNIQAVIAVSVILISLIGAACQRKDILNDSVQVYVKYTDPETQEVSAEHTMRYYRWAANMNMIKANFFKGVGLGQYGKRLKEYYSGISIPEGRTDVASNYNVKASEPFSFGLVFILLSELGIFGFAVFLATLAVTCLTLFTSETQDWSKSAVLMSLIAVIIISLYANPLTRGCGGAFSLLISLGAFGRK